MTRKNVDPEEASEAIETIEEVVEGLEKISDSPATHVDFRAQIDQLRSEKRELEESVGSPESYSVSEESVEDALQEFGATEGVDTPLVENAAVLVLEENRIDDLLSLYKVYTGSDSNLPRDSDLNEQLKEFLQENY